MNIDELRDQLEQIAGPVPRPTSVARAAVGQRVRRARRRRNLVAGGGSTLAAALVVALVAVGLNDSNGSVDVRTTTASTTRVSSDPQCALRVATVPNAGVPIAVRRWASGAPVVGGGELWTARRSIASGAIHDGSVWRLKIGWVTTPFGIPAITARRLDGPGVATGDANEAIDGRGRWVASTIELPSAGCWEISARVHDSSIVFRRLIGNPPEPLAIGTIAGVLQFVGGPAPGTPRPVVGTIHVDGATTAVNDFGASVATDANGRFRVDVPTGSHHVAATSPQYQGGRSVCTAGIVVVRRAETTDVVVGCPIR